MNSNEIRRMFYLTLQALAATLLMAACSDLSAPKVASQNIYVLDAEPTIQPFPVKRNLVFLVSMPRALPGFDTPQMAYVKQPHELNYFAKSRWADTPARMLEPLVVQAIKKTESFRAVVQASDLITADVRLDIELVRLQQDFKMHPSRVQLVLRAHLVDMHDKRLLASQEFEEVETASREDAYGGVTAINRLLQRVLGELAEFCVNASASGSQLGRMRPEI